MLPVGVSDDPQSAVFQGISLSCSPYLTAHSFAMGSHYIVTLFIDNSRRILVNSVLSLRMNSWWFMSVPSQGKWEEHRPDISRYPAAWGCSLHNKTLKSPVCYKPFHKSPASRIIGIALTAWMAYYHSRHGARSRLSSVKKYALQKEFRLVVNIAPKFPRCNVYERGWM